jgi:histidine triad (HIT) family protein
MIAHEPKDYICPLCKLVNKEIDEINKLEYIIFENEYTLAYVAPKWWKNNPGHVLVIPKLHTENIYTISEALIGEVYKTAKKIALALKIAYQCDGTSTRQHNEPGRYPVN